MNSRWPPPGKIVRITWARPEAYGFKRHNARARGYRAMLVLAAAGSGIVGAAAWRWWPSQPPQDGSNSAIEWNAVQAVPKRAPDPEDVQ